MTMAETTVSVVLRYDLGWEDVREIMATSRILVLLRRSWTVAGLMFAGLLAESIALLRTVVTRAAVYRPSQGSLRGELIAAAGFCALLAGWSALRVWRLSTGHQARHALAAGVWQSGVHQYKLRDEGVAWKAPDGSAVFLPWSALTGVRETPRMFLLLDQGNQHVRGFIPKAGVGDLAPGTALGDLIRARIAAGSS
jgi:YcxB-like protein